ncbi:Gfo/Idh/MocA family protein [Paenibacillus sacheonensis]|uniref:Gfo/Idh/MocA family oxidoreductase n=1 Tax=Paenibacillus sacheonensis TaxID=742054 RepID=A0A7X5C018_9BACL|nr:Gfo/Idh/MocA family oxidoreductase [Paenibacillus sacheonensis]MBM7567615.1 putative dehydrogenase [Paenibacillus sacheonensis]NBC71282.1 Gfo/Idh/MocA family oxidoreductase [Paenibacillus sacheonensis]
MKTWNVCLVGMGYWSDVHFRAWLSVPNVRIAAIVDRNPPKLAKKAALYGLSEDQLFTTLPAALEAAEIDIVDVITRPDSHLQMTETAARAGKHVLCQKPFAPTIAECERMVAICEEEGVRLMVAEGWRWQGHYLAMKRVLDSGVLGGVSYAKVSAKWFFSPRWDDPAKMTQPYFREMDRLLLYEMGPHYIDSYRSLFGDPEGVTAVVKRVSPHIKGDDLAILILHHPGMTGMIEASWAAREFRDGGYNQPDGENLMEYVVIEGSEATLRLTADGELFLLRTDGSVERVPREPEEFQQSHNRLHRHFVAGLESGAPFATSGEEYMKTMRIIEKAYQVGEKVERIG